jgi:hypothetical protein
MKYPMPLIIRDQLSPLAGPGESLVDSCILGLDQELGFLWALSDELRAYGISAIPAHSVAEAELLLREIRPRLTLAIIDCRCSGALPFARAVRRDRPTVPIIGLTRGALTGIRTTDLFSVTLPHPLNTPAHWMETAHNWSAP